MHGKRKMDARSLFSSNQPVIACIHLKPLPGSPLYNGDLNAIFEQAILEARIFVKYGVHGLIIENFGDKPFFPEKVPAETIASMSAIGREIVKEVDIPIGINVLRNDAESALAIATAIEAQFIRVNVHMHAVVSDQGIISGRSYNTLRLRQNLLSPVLIFADVGVKHATPLNASGLDFETIDLCERGLVDAVIVSGKSTGSETNSEDVHIVKKHSSLPLFIGSGITPENLANYKEADGFIVGSYFKEEGKAVNPVDEKRVQHFMHLKHL